MKNLVKETFAHTAIFSIGGVLQQGLQIFLLPLYANLFSVEEYGFLNIFMVFGIGVSVTLSAVIPPAVMRSWFDYDSLREHRMVVSTACVVSLLMALVMIVPLFLLAETISSWIAGTNTYALFLQLVVASNALLGINALFLSILRVQKKSIHFVVVNLIGGIVIGLVTIYTLLKMQIGIIGIAYGMFAGAIVSNFLLIILSSPYLRLVFSAMEAIKMIRFGSPIIVDSWAHFLMHNADKLLINSLLGPVAVGIYSTAEKICQIAAVGFFQPFGLILSPIALSAEKRPDAVQFYRRLAVYFAVISLFIMLCLTLLAKHLLYLFFPEKYWSAALYIPFVITALFIYNFRGLFSIGLFLKRKTIWVGIVNALVLTIYFPLIILLIPQFGIAGVSISLIMCYLIMNVFFFYRSEKTMKIGFEWQPVLRITILTGTLFAIFSSINQVWWIDVASFLVAILLFLLGVWAFVFNKSEKKFVVNHIRHIKFK